MNADLGLYIAFWFIGLQSIVVFLSIDMALPINDLLPNY